MGYMCIHQKALKHLECCDEVLSPIVRSGIKRSDFIFDIYPSDSLKKGERIRCGCDDNNKTQLFYLIADVISEGENQHMTIVGTKGIEVVSNKEINKYNISPCTQEEAGIHVRELLNQFPRIKVVTVDSDVVISKDKSSDCRLGCGNFQG